MRDALNEILIWPARDSGPVIHFWFEQDCFHRRVCDGEYWAATQRTRLSDMAVPCRICKDLYLQDVLHGRKVLTLALSEFTPHNMDIYPYYGVEKSISRVDTRERGMPVMPRISMTQFAKFYEVRPADQVRIVRDIRMQIANPDDNYMARNFYGFLLQELRRTHFATGDIRYFEDNLETFVNGLQDKRKHQAYLAIGEAYVEWWNQRSGELFEVPSVGVEVDGLTIGVRPEVGIRNGRDFEVLKLWFNASKPSRQTRQIILHLMGMARVLSQEWPSSWNVGIWDVRRQEIPPPIRTARDFELGLAGQVAAFMQIWRKLDEQAQLAES